jgi:uncharacterized protein
VTLGKYGATGEGHNPLALFRDIHFPNGFTVFAELALEPDQLIRGLMFREHLDPDQGMLFVHQKPGFYPVWMKNTLVPLDVLWLDAKRMVVELACGAQPCKSDDECPQYGGRYSSVYVLEVPSGTIRRNHLMIGDRVSW